jgi:ABC-2 type transport system ATP-binding protein
MSGIEVTGLTRRFGRLTAVDGATFSVPAGRVAGFLGPNGAGKTTTLELLAGLLLPHAGQLRVGGLDPVAQREQVLATTGALIEAPGFFGHLTAEENLLWLGSLGRATSPAQLRPRAVECLETLGLAPHAGRPVRGFSTGMRMRLALALAVLHRPRFLLLDEPTAGLDPLGRRTVRDLVAKASRDDGATAFISSHQLEEIEAVCDWLVVIDGGRIVAQGPMSELLPSSGESRFAARIEPLEPAEALLLEREGVSAVERDGPELRFRGRREQIPELVAAAVGRGLRVHELRDLGRSVESFYLDATKAPATAGARPEGAKP